MKSIKTKMLITILPIIILSMIFLTFNSANTSKKSILEQTGNLMSSELNGEITNISREIGEIEMMANMISSTVSNTYGTTTLKEYEKVLGEIIYTNDLAMGGGIWFEPYQFDKAEKYVGPYIYKDGEQPAVTYDYSNAEYDYFSYEWYQNALKSEGKPVFTEPYYDETLGVTLSSCTVPVINQGGSFIGAVTVDIELTTIQNLVNSIQVGEGGKALLLGADGSYLSCLDSEKIMKQKIQEEENTSLAELGSQILQKKEGSGSYTDGNETYRVYFKTLPELNWILVIEIPESELNAPVQALTVRMAGISIGAIVLCFAVVLYMVGSLSSNLKKVNHFTGVLSEGDLRSKELKLKGKDELKQMSDSLNNMFVNNRSIIKHIAENSETLNESSGNLTQAAGELTVQFNNIADIMNKVNEDMMSSSAATQEVNASVEEVNSSANVLLEETGRSNELAAEIGKRAAKVKVNSRNSYEKAADLTKAYESELAQSMDNAKIVESVSLLADVISEIADQINLLSLNASIEAARAGEQGRGFAVVAGEIGKLAGQTASAVNEIKETTEKIEDAFELLIQTAKELLGFITQTVSPDYKAFVHTATQYESDAETIKDFSEKISEMSRGIEHIINEVSQAVQSIAYSTQNTSDNSSRIIESILVMEKTVNEVGDMSKEQSEMSKQLYDVVNKFKL
ncbi:methyl-accepting chemotaxis sensory transducer with Cache sensor [Kineothrix alysoides]|uniref:Methyl-accepting chemotaxis sensory transducer with Cache sensor n=1 Tax=Kineothrix alysoides TaxID=1469948 RepID=A0A4R1QYE6_9FIRM|nr:methyl-accepting chemotaxis protein [Kineothrix alysoides]TCL57320.1 methyl-accepting chemotaxis sensory transducer with Cache sensor [Kineothrix alysoides]